MPLTYIIIIKRKFTRYTISYCFVSIAYLKFSASECSTRSPCFVRFVIRMSRMDCFLFLFILSTYSHTSSSFRAQNRASGIGGQQQGRRQKVTNQVIRKGWLQLGGGGVLKGSKDYWFVLTGKLFLHSCDLLEFFGSVPDLHRNFKLSNNY